MNREEINDETQVKVIISDDRMTVWLEIEGEEDDRQLLDLVKEKLEELGVVKGIQYGALADRAPGEICTIATGVEQTRGKDGWIEYFFSVNKMMELIENAEGIVDYKDLGLIENVRKGAVLCRIHPPTCGEVGVDVFGNTRDGLWGEQMTVPAGKNTAFDEEQQVVIATSDGQVLYQNGQIQVRNVYQINGDVDGSTGNIFFWGSVLINGDVREGFTVVAEGDVLVRGAVEGAQIKSSGTIRIDKGMNGMGRGVLDSRDAIYCGYIEHSTIKTKGNIYAEVILNSQLQCQGDLHLKGRKGSLIGGNHEIGGVIDCKHIGSDNSGSTTINFFAQPKESEAYRYQEEKKELEETLMEMEKKMGLLLKLNQAGRLSLEKKRDLIKYLEDAKSKKIRLEELERLIEQEEQKGRKERIRMIVCRDTIHEGTKILVENDVLVVRQHASYCVIYRDGEGIHIGSGI